MAIVDYFSLLVTACHRLFTYHCLVPVLAGKNDHRLVLFAGKSEHHLDLVNTCFTPTNFYVHGSQVKVHPGARACSFRFRHIRTHTHTRTQPTVSIDISQESLHLGVYLLCVVTVSLLKQCLLKLTRLGIKTLPVMCLQLE